MDLIGAATVVLAVIGLALAIAVKGISIVGKAQRHGRVVRSLPWWYVGGQPEMPDRPEERVGPSSDRAR